MRHSGHETEIKLAVSSAAEARRKLRAAGFHVSKRKVFERNAVFDTPDQALRRARKLLRIREIRKDAKLTFKGPPEDSKHKSREELELTVGNASAMRAILERLGYHPTFLYEKFRTEFSLLRSKGVATLDETPIGVYLELEGAPDWIDRTARKLGFDDADYITASYGSLYLAWCEQHSIKPSNMVFEERAARRANSIRSAIRDQHAGK
jgi:adenylate cyclase class 2